MDIKQLNKQYIANTYGRYDIQLVRGVGAIGYDEKGTRYIDCTSGVGTNSFGFADPTLVAAITEQAGKMIHSSNYFYNEPATLLAKMLCERTGMSKVFFSNSGTEATEGAIKAARKYSHDKYGKGRSKIVCLHDSFHGRTMASLSATGQDLFHQHFFPFVEGFDFATAGDVAEISAKVDESTCAVLIEIVQGEGGVFVLDKEYVQAVAKLCAERDVLLLIDEVQTGNGRCGTLFAYMDYEIKPDIFYTAKGLGGGLPIGAIVFNEKTSTTFGAGHHGSTFGGNPLCTAGALSIFSRIDDAFMADVRRKGDYIRARLSESSKIKSVSGLGMMIGFELVDGLTAPEVVQECLKRGLMILTAKHKGRLLPPLNITDEELTEAMDILMSVLA